MDSCINFKEFNLIDKLYNEMMQYGLKPTEVTYGIMIKAYGKSGNISKANDLF